MTAFSTKSSQSYGTDAQPDGSKCTLLAPPPKDGVARTIYLYDGSPVNDNTKQTEAERPCQAIVFDAGEPVGWQCLTREELDDFRASAVTAGAHIEMSCEPLFDCPPPPMQLVGTQLQLAHDAMKAQFRTEFQSRLARLAKG